MTMEIGIFVASVTSQIVSYVTGLFGFKKASKVFDVISYVVLSIVGVELFVMTLLAIYFGLSQII